MSVNPGRYEAFATNGLAHFLSFPLTPCPFVPKMIKIGKRHKKCSTGEDNND